MNGVDTLSYLDINSATVIPFTALSTPSAPTLTTNTGLSGTAFNSYYAVSANSSVGESTASAALVTAVSADRDLWDPKTQSLTIGWSPVSGAKSYNIYEGQVAPGGVPTLYLIAKVDSQVVTFQDDGSFAQDSTRPAPTTNSSAGPVATRAANINGRVFLVGCADNPYYVRYGGDFGFELDFSPANGGGFTPVGNGKDLPIAVKSFRDAHGSQQITVLCEGTNGKGKRFVLTPDSLTIGNTTVEFFDVTEDSGQDGTDSPDAVVLYNDSLWYPSRDGFKTTGTKPQLQNVLSTDRVSNTIQTDISLLSNSAMNKAVGVGFEGRLYWALPVDDSVNNEIWVLDLQRGGAWMKPWNIAADWLWLYNDNSGNTHMLVLQNNEMLELSRIVLTADNGVPYSTSGSSGIITFSPDMRQWGQLIQVVFTLLRPQGKINFQISGRTEDSTSLVQLASKAFDETVSTVECGWGEAEWGTYAWSDFQQVPTVAGDDVVDVIVEVDAEVQYWEYSWNSVDAGVDYNLSHVVGEFVPLGVRDLT